MPRTLYQHLKDKGIAMDHYRSDLYIPVNETTTEILKQHRVSFTNATKFKRRGSKDDIWYDIPFAYDPYWEEIHEKIHRKKSNQT